MQYHFLRFAGTNRYLGETLDDQRVHEEPPVDPTQVMPRAFARIETAEAVAEYINSETGAEFEIVSQDYDWIEPEDVDGEPTPQPEPEPDPNPEPQPDPKPDPEPVGTVWLLDNLDTAHVAAITDNATLKPTASGVFNVEWELPEGFANIVEFSSEAAGTRTEKWPIWTAFQNNKPVAATGEHTISGIAYKDGAEVAQMSRTFRFE